MCWNNELPSSCLYWTCPVDFWYRFWDLTLSDILHFLLLYFVLCPWCITRGIFFRYTMHYVISTRFNWSSDLLHVHDDVIKWKHFPRYWPFVRGIHRYPVPGEFPTQRPVTRSFDVFFDLRLYKPLHKQSWGWWFETPSRSLWRHRYVNGMIHWNVYCMSV